MYFWFYLCLVFGVGVAKDSLAKQFTYAQSNRGKIIGGNNVTIQEIPYQAYLRISQLGDAENQYHQCGGSIISAYYILSAAHCFINATKVEARIGSSEAASGGQTYNAAFYRTHPRYNPVTKHYDIGFLRTLKKMQLDNINTKSITLVERKKVIPSGTLVTVSGWGLITPEGPLSPTLKAANLKTISNEECNNIHGGISNTQLCAGLEDGSEDFCKGDSGGPVVLSDSKVQVGIVSASYGCAVAGSPGILVNVTDLRDWIHRNTGV